MQARKSFTSKLSARQIGLGLAALGRPGYINLGHDQDIGEDKSIEAIGTKAHRVLDAAWGAGIRYLDAARSYGRAEEFLGSWIAKKKLDPQELLVGSKWGYRYVANWQSNAETHEIKDHSIEMLLSQFAESQSRLGVNLDLYQIHSATQESGVLRKKRVLNHLAKLREDGLAIGLSLSGPKQQETLGEALQVERDGEKLFDAVQVTWNIFESSIASMAEAAHDAGVIVIIKESLANGRLTNRNKDPGDKMRLKILDEIANTHRTTIDAVAIAAALAQPWANIVLSGAATKGQLLSNLAAKEITLTDEEMGQLGEEAEDPKEYWYARGNLNWN